jgi:hypothetical protein
VPLHEAIGNASEDVVVGFTEGEEAGGGEELTYRNTSNDLTIECKYVIASIKLLPFPLTFRKTSMIRPLNVSLVGSDLC